jgi:hypothetical protein
MAEVNVDALEVVPVVLGCLHTVADEDHVGALERHLRHDVLGPGHHVLRELERAPIITRAHRQVRVGRRGDADERHLLDVAAVGIARCEPELPELLLEVGDRLLLAGGPGQPPFELVGRQRPDMREHRSAIHRRQRGCGLCVAGNRRERHYGKEGKNQSAHAGETPPERLYSWAELH